jgi:hypothetical protein
MDRSHAKPYRRQIQLQLAFSNELPMSVDIKTIAEGAAKVKAGGQLRMGFQSDIQAEFVQN